MNRFSQQLDSLLDDWRAELAQEDNTVTAVVEAFREYQQGKSEARQLLFSRLASLGNDRSEQFMGAANDPSIGSEQFRQWQHQVESGQRDGYYRN